YRFFSLDTCIKPAQGYIPRPEGLPPESRSQCPTTASRLVSPIRLGAICLTTPRTTSLWFALPSKNSAAPSTPHSSPPAASTSSPSPNSRTTSPLRKFPLLSPMGVPSLPSTPRRSSPSRKPSKPVTRNSPHPPAPFARNATWSPSPAANLECGGLPPLLRPQPHHRTAFRPQPSRPIFPSNLC